MERGDGMISVYEVKIDFMNRLIPVACFTDKKDAEAFCDVLSDDWPKDSIYLSEEYVYENLEEAKKVLESMPVAEVME